MPFYLSKKQIEFLLESGDVFVLRRYRMALKGDLYKDYVIDAETCKRVAIVLVEYEGKVVRENNGWIVILSAPIHILGVSDSEDESVIERTELENYLEKSGYGSVEEWVDTMRDQKDGEIPKIPNKLYLFKLELIHIYKKFSNNQLICNIPTFYNMDSKHRESSREDEISKSESDNLDEIDKIIYLDVFT